MSDPITSFTPAPTPNSWQDAIAISDGVPGSRPERSVDPGPTETASGGTSIITKLPPQFLEVLEMVLDKKLFGDIYTHHRKLKDFEQTLALELEQRHHDHTKEMMRLSHKLATDRISSYTKAATEIAYRILNNVWTLAFFWAILQVSLLLMAAWLGGYETKARYVLST
ncbi:hypothetical protein QBC35DRAFT_477168 [Podospora australis]|uniref:Uncharacterized protein n=1 Tax=Podospora australis TaxID=1536484 RepID=A0AAN6WQG9_9PEZI|nr:hypothetical protein QBC35DRAFT_477168 [Podospora australis]